MDRQERLSYLDKIYPFFNSLSGEEVRFALINLSGCAFCEGNEKRWLCNYILHVVNGMENLLREDP